MDYNLPEDETEMDCMSFAIEKPLNNMTMRSDSKPYTETLNPPIKNMLNDEAPDNLLSSAALEKNIFSDDDELGLHRLKRLSKNLENPTLDLDLNTDDVIKQESALDGIDDVNFPALPPAPPSITEPPPPPSSNPKDFEMDDDEENSNQSSTSLQSNDKPKLLYRSYADPFVAAKVNGDLMNNGSYELDDEEECEDRISWVMNDHNYMNPPSSFEATTRFLINAPMTSEQILKVQDMIAARMKQEAKDLRVDDKMDDSQEKYEDTVADDGFSTASTEDFSDPTGPDAEENECIIRQSVICKEELILDETPKTQQLEGSQEKPNNSNEREISSAIEESPEDIATGVNQQEELEKEENNEEIASEAKTEELKNSSADEPPENPHGGEVNKIAEEVSSISFSDNHSEPNEYFELEDNGSSTTTDAESEGTEKQVELQANALLGAVNQKVVQIREFGKKLIEINPDAEDGDESLQKLMNELLTDFQKIVGSRKQVDAGIQTEKVYSKRKMNEKAKRRLLDASSSDSSCSSLQDDDDDDEDDEAEVGVDEPLNANRVGVDSEEEDDDEEKIEKSPSYSDLSGHESDEYLDTEVDENEIQSNSDGIDLSLYIVKSGNGQLSEDGDGIDLSKYEIHSEAVTDAADAESVTELIPLRREIIEEKKAEDDNIQMDFDGNEMSVGDVEMNEVESDGMKVDPVEEDAKDTEESNEIDCDDFEEDNQQLLEDEKLKLDSIVLVEKLSDEDLEKYFDELRDKEILKLLNYSGLIKRRITEASSTITEKAPAPIRSKLNKKLVEIFQEAENEMCSDESNSEAEEEIITEREFLKQCNVKAKEEFLKLSSSDSEADTKISEEEDDDVLEKHSDFSSSDDEERPSIVEKFLGKISTKKLPEPALHVSNEIVENVKESEIASPVQEEKQDEKESEVIMNGDVQLHDSPGECSLGAGSDDVVEINDKVDEIEKADSEKSKPSTSRGGYGSIRHLLDDKEIDLDAMSSIGKDKPGTSKAKEDDLDAVEMLLRRPATTKSLETLLTEDARRRKNTKSTDIVMLSSDSDSEDVSIEPEIRKRIKPMLRKDQLAGETRTAQRRENERIKRLEKKTEMLQKLVRDHKEKADLIMTEDRELVLDYISDSKQFVKVHPELVKHLKEHQFDGIKFMYDNTYGSADSIKKNPGSGCILAHCMGLGKTLQMVALIHTVIHYKELNTSKILVLCPKSTVLNWSDEIRRWLGPLRSGNLKLFTLRDASSIQEKLLTLQEWSCSGQPGYRRAGCLMIGYEAFRMLVFFHLYKKKKVLPSQIEKIKAKIRETLLEPGADLVICDEGHIIKNRKSATSAAVSEISTLRRIILTGTPIQNNLKEYYAMVNFIKPKFLGTEKEFANLYENPIRNGQHKDSNKRDIKIMKQRSFVLHKKLSKFVQRREAALLKTFLPMKFEYVLFIPMSIVQIKLYEFFLEACSRREGSRGKNLIPDYTCLRKIWTHPRVLENAWKNAMLMKNKRDNKKSPLREPNSDDEVPDDVYDTQTGALSVTDDWWRPLLTDDNLKSILPSNKLQVMFEILRMCEEYGEKCLIFSAFVAVLDCVEYFMNEITKQSEKAAEYGLAKYRGPWISGKDYYRLDGKTPKNIRHEMIKHFNDPSMTRARVFLISAKAGGQGINLIGANRVMILDTSWNPSNDQQNIFRVFRLGQKRMCYVYRLLAMGTMEEKVYSRSVTKQAMSFRVVDEQQIDRHYSMAELTELYALTKPDYQNRPVPELPQDSILKSLLRNFPHLVYKYHEHDSLLENKMEQELSEQEKADAWDAYERDLQTNENPEFLPSLGNFPMLPNAGAYLPHGMGYGYPPGRGYPFNYGYGVPQGLMPGTGYNSNSTLLDMLKMFPTNPPGSSPMMSALNATNPANLLYPYASGVLPPPPQTSSSLPMSLPPFSSLQGMVQSTGAGSIPSFTASYSSMANSYNLASDPAFLSLSQMYASSLSAATSGSSTMPVDSRSMLMRPPIITPPASNLNDTRSSPFATSLVGSVTTTPVTSTATESIPISVIKPPQAHNASTSRHPLPPPPLPSPTHASNPLSPHHPVNPPHAHSSSSSPRLPGPSHSTPSARVSAAQNLPPLQSPAGPVYPSSRPGVPIEFTALQQQTVSHHSRSSAQAPIQAQLQSVHSQQPRTQSPLNTPQTNQSGKEVVKPHIIMKNISVTQSQSSGTNHNSSPITVSRNSPQLKTSTGASLSRSTNMGIIYPDNGATITPIITTNAGPGSTAPSILKATVPSNPSNISVRTVSSINSTAAITPGAKSMSAIQKSLVPANLSTSISILKQGAVGPLPKNPSAMSPNTVSISVTKSTNPSPHAAPKLATTKTLPSVDTSNTNSIQNSPQQQRQNVQLRQNRSNPNLSSVNMDKSPIQISPTNNVQFTKVGPPDKVGNAKRNAVKGPQLQPSRNNNVPQPSQFLKPVNNNTIITKVRSQTGMTVLSVQNSSPTTAAKVPPNLNSNAVPTLVPFNSKKTKATPVTIPHSAPLGQSLAGIKKVDASNVIRVGSSVTKPFKPATTVQRTVSVPNLSKSAIGGPTLPTPISTPPRSLLVTSQQGHTGSAPMTYSKQQNAALSRNAANKSPLGIRSIDALNKFANAGITISANRKAGQSSSSTSSLNSVASGVSNTSKNSITLSKIGTAPQSRKRPANNSMLVGPMNNVALPVSQAKRPRPGSVATTERKIAESLIRARTNQGLTIQLKNPTTQGNQRLMKDGKGKVTDVVEID